MRILTAVLVLLMTQELMGQASDSLVVWRGIMIPSGKSYADAQVLWLRLPANTAVIKQNDAFLSRQELYQTEFYALHRLSLYQDNDELVVEDAKSHKKKLNRGVPFCRMIYRLKYNQKTGYLEGTYMASDCRGVSGRVVLYRTDHTISETNQMTETHAWVKRLIDDLKANKLAPAKIAEMRANFEFKPLYFDFDKATIREEYKPYLKEMAFIVLSHSDLRIKVTGHTDGDGSDAYNMDLSKRRATAILSFFVELGIPPDRIEIDFRGKREPVAPNTSAEGKQKNRRVDFAFI
jgi:outer membrane protein OmpA-like peptidoglycan-associated protein